MIKETLLQISKNFLNLSELNINEIENASKLMMTALEAGGKIMFCGNGGSAADAQHLSTELVGRYRKNRRSLASIALTTDTSLITAISNDYSFEEIFSRQLEAFGQMDDILYAISCSGTSKNVIKAILTAKERGIKVIGLTGISGGDMNNLCDIIIKVPSDRTDRIQEMHIAIGQILCEIIEEKLC